MVMDNDSQHLNFEDRQERHIPSSLYPVQSLFSHHCQLDQ